MITTLTTIIFAVYSNKSNLQLSLYPHISQHYQLWRLFTSQMSNTPYHNYKNNNIYLVFTNSAELLFGCTLLYQLRIFERNWSSSKFASFIVSTGILSLTIQLIVLAFSNIFKITKLANGPYPLIAALLYRYQRDIPFTQKFEFVGMEFNEKAFMYLMSLQVNKNNILLINISCCFRRILTLWYRV